MSFKPYLGALDIPNEFRERDRQIAILIPSARSPDSCIRHFALSDPSLFKVLIQLEPPVIRDFTDSIIQHHQKFDLIIAWHEPILENCSNAVKYTYGTHWVNLNTFKPNKKNEISFITSSKRFCEAHELRQRIFQALLSTASINEFSIRNIKTPPRIENKNEVFENAKFSIVVENESIRNWMTEKLMDCFVTRTVPIYCGCPNVGEYFCEKGVLTFSTLPELGEILNKLRPERYDEMVDSIEKNYETALQYGNFHERMDKEIDLYLS
jgi:hypothetical protein